METLLSQQSKGRSLVGTLINIFGSIRLIPHRYPAYSGSGHTMVAKFAPNALMTSDEVLARMEARKHRKLLVKPAVMPDVPMDYTSWGQHMHKEIKGLSVRKA